MSQTYFAILTAVGEAKLANATALGTQLQISRMAVGDGNGNLPTPNRIQTALLNERYRADLNTLQVDPVNASQIIAELVIPETEGGYWLREMGLYDAAGDLIAVSNCPPSYKPQLAEGSGRTQVLRMVLIVSSSAAVQLKIDPSVVLATRSYVDAAIVVAMNRQDAKQSVRMATKVDISLNGLQTLDGVLAVAGDRVLVKDQTTGSQNGIYIAAVGAWARSADADENAEVTPALTVSVEEGNLQADTVWQLITNAPIVIGTTALVFEDITHGLARLASPAFTGNPSAPTRATGDSTESLATTEFVQDALQTAPSIAGLFKNLKCSATGTSAVVNITADEIIVGGSAGLKRLTGVSASASFAVARAGGLDVGAANSQTAAAWYYLWLIWDGTTTAGLLSLSSTAPTMPAGYTHKARVGSVRPDGTGNKYPLGFAQFGRKVSLVVKAGTNVPALPLIISGIAGDISAPTWVASSLANHVPPTGSKVRVISAKATDSSSMILAPSNGYGGLVTYTNMPPVSLNSPNPYANVYGVMSEFLLETMAISYASNGATNNVRCMGWDDNL